MSNETKNVPIKELVVGKEYVFGSYSERYGFSPISINYYGTHSCRAFIEKVGRKYVTVRFECGRIDKKYCGEGFFEIDVAKRAYRASLKARQAGGYRQSDEEINILVERL